MKTVKITIPNKVKTNHLNSLSEALTASKFEYNTIAEKENIVFLFRVSDNVNIANIRSYIREWVPNAEEFINSYSVDGKVESYGVSVQND